MTQDPLIRCAVYTRKSSDEGLEQDFNSLQAQRSACEAYIESQAALGWQLIATNYDDGGYSGGTLDRPALTSLLHDVKVGRINIIVVHKIDRLTRSIRDFGRIAESIEKHGASIASVTQQFNTFTSLGRLTLNMLLSFAQFERELTSERIREKLRASRERGMWMGGVVPFGYAAHGRTLLEHPTDGSLLRSIFGRYLENGNLGALQRALRADPRFGQARLGKPGKLISTGALRHLLSNRIYVGQICSKGVCCPGKHPPLVEDATFETAQTLLGEGSVRYRQRRSHSQHFSLVGLVCDEAGRKARVVSVRRAQLRHRYYAIPTNTRRLRRIPAAGLERVVKQAMEALKDWALENSIELPASRTANLAKAVVVGDTEVTIQLSVSVVEALIARGPANFARRDDIELAPGYRLALTVRSASLTQAWKAQSFPRLKAASAEPRTAKLQTWSRLSRAHSLLNQLLAGTSDFAELCARERLTDKDVLTALEPAFLPPEEVRLIVVS